MAPFFGARLNLEGGAEKRRRFPAQISASFLRRTAIGAEVLEVGRVGQVRVWGGSPWWRAVLLPWAALNLKSSAHSPMPLQRGSGGSTVLHRYPLARQCSI